MTDPTAKILELLRQRRITQAGARQLIAALNDISPSGPRNPESRPIAIIGMGFDLPGASTEDQLWRMLMRGQSALAPPSAERRRLAGAALLDTPTPEQLESPSGYLDHIDMFDADFFGILPGEAHLLDPQQRRALQVAYRCFEQAGQVTRIRGSRTGVFFAAEDSRYSRGLPYNDPIAVTGNLASFVGSRISNQFDLRAPTYITSVDEASPLVAFHDACSSLRAGECDMAMVGAASLLPYLVPPSRLQGGNAAPAPFGDRPCPGLDSEAIITVLLKPLEQAQRDNDRIRAVVAGSALAHHGALAVSDQSVIADLMTVTWDRANLDVNNLIYVEGHGGGTRETDAAELLALDGALRRRTDRQQFVAVGSAKPNVGSSGVTSALAGLLKAVLILERGPVPPTAGLDAPTRSIDFVGSSLYLPTGRAEQRGPRAGAMAAVNALGVNGAVAHVVLATAPPEPAARVHQGSFVFPVSARTEEALQTRLRDLGAARLESPPADVAATLSLRREHFEHRCVIVADTIAAFQTGCRHLATNVGNRRWPRNVASDSVSRLGEAYLDHATCNWGDQFGDTSPRVATLPGYPFSERSYWVDLSESSRPDAFDPDAPTPARFLRVIAEALGIEEVPVDASFLDLGGNSLSALRVQMRLRENGLQVSLEEMLSAPTLTELAESVIHEDPEASRSAVRVAARSFPLSAAQQRFWFLQHADDADDASFHVPSHLRLVGELDVAALRRAMEQMHQRHDVLRSRFPTDESGAVTMEVVDALDVPLSVTIDATGTLIRETIEEPFDLEQGPVWRALLMQSGENQYDLVVVFHHLVADIWALRVFFDELWTLYRAHRRGQPVELPALRYTYGQITETEQQDTTRHDVDQQFWSQQLAEAPAGMTLSLRQDRTVQATPATIEFTINEKTAQLVRDFASHSSATPFAVYLGAFAGLLRDRTGCEDLLVGTELYNRSRPGADAVLGVFVNQVPIRMNVSHNPTFKELVNAARDTLRLTLQHGGFPFQEINKLSSVRPGQSLFQTKILYNLYDGKGERPDDGLLVSYPDIDEVAAPFDVTMRLLERTDGTGAVRGAITYKASMFDHSEVDQLIDRYLRIVDSAVAQPDSRLSSLVKTARSTERKATMSVRSMRGRRRSSSGDVIASEVLPEQNGLQPLLVRPTVAGVDLATVIASRRDFVEEKLIQHGAIMFRGFEVRSVESFREAATAVHPEFVEYTEPSTPRGEYEDKVYVSSEYPAWYEIPLHGELSYTYEWPMKALFFSKRPATKGGATTVGDARRILERLDRRVLRKFEEKGIMYIRNYGEGMLVPWQTVFKTDDPNDVQAHCDANPPMSCEWLADSVLRTRQIRPATRVHPVTGQKVWFNQAHIFHPYSLGADMRDKLVEQFGPEGLPVTAAYGDGEPIEDRDLDAIYDAMTSTRYSTPWEQGDVLLADNMLVSHGREAFEGERETVVCFVEPCPPSTPDIAPAH